MNTSSDGYNHQIQQFRLGEKVNIKIHKEVRQLDIIKVEATIGGWMYCVGHTGGFVGYWVYGDELTKCEEVSHG
jgi:hypothetical protein